MADPQHEDSHDGVLDVADDPIVADPATLDEEEAGRGVAPL
jgi:hypothetical protein